MTDEPLILAERKNNILTITLNRPDRLNAAPVEMFDAIRAELQALDGARAVLIQGAGRAFCSGADVASGALNSSDPAATTYKALTEHYNPALQTIVDLEVPVISAVRGPVAGIGVSLALAADFCIASETAFFLQAFVNIGLVADGGSSWLLPRLIGRARAAELMLLGERLPAAKALEWGMIHRVVENDSLEAEALTLAERLAGGPSVAIGMMKRNLAWALEHGFSETMQREAESQRAARGTRDAAEGGKAFLEKRKAVFTGS